MKTLLVLLVVSLFGCSVEATFPDLKKTDGALTDPAYPCGEGGLDCSNGTCCPNPLRCSLAKNPDGSGKLDETNTSIPVCTTYAGEEKQLATKCSPPACAELATTGVKL